MSVLECLKWQNFVDTSDDFANTEGKSGVPRFDGEASRLAEYCFRVRLQDTKIKNMDATEAKKLGPLGIRLVEGLRSQALHVAGEIPMDKLASADGPNILLEFLQKAFRPRRLQEARELYTAGAQQYGVLARQPGEPMPSFLLRRRTWQRMLKDLDPDLQVPEGILAEQTLLCSGISHEQQLLVRTALRGSGSAMTLSAVMDELIAQHARIHEREVRRGGHHQGRGHHRGKGHPHRSQKPWQSWNAEEEPDTTMDWDGASQSLGGYEDDDASAYYAGGSEVQEGDEDPVLEAYEALCIGGLDEQDPEALEYAAEALQAESEVFYIHQRAHGVGHTGFGDRSFGKGKGKGRMSPDEKRARIDAIKKKTRCRACNMVGHWSTDVECPKGRGKGRKGGSPSTSSSTTAGGNYPNKGYGGGKGGKGRGPPHQPKERTVYFTVNEFGEEEEMEGVEYAFMAYRQVPPTADLLQGQIVETPTDEESADTMLERAIQEANARLQLGALRGVPGLPCHESSLIPVPEGSEADWEVAMSVTSSITPSVVMLEPADQPGQMVPFNVFGAAAQPPRSATPMPVPSPASLPSPSELGSVCKHETITKAGSNAYVKIRRCADCGELLEKTRIDKEEPSQPVQPRASPASERSSSECQHLNKDYRGTTATTWRWKCKDCGAQESGSKQPGETGYAGATSSATPVPGEAQPSGQAEDVVKLMAGFLAIQREMRVPVTGAHLDIIYSKCKQMVFNQGVQGFTTPSTLRPPSTTRTSRSNATSSGISPTPSAPASPIDAREVNDVILSGVHKGKTFIEVAQTDTRYSFFLMQRLRENYLKEPSLIEFARYCNHVLNRAERSAAALSATPMTPTALMGVMKDLGSIDFPVPTDEQYLIAVLDTGCNNTCHGSDWIKEYMRLTGLNIPLEPIRAGSYRGVGGKIKVAGRRRIPVLLQLKDGQEASGMIVSTELEGSEAPLPLLLSIPKLREPWA